MMTTASGWKDASKLVPLRGSTSQVYSMVDNAFAATTMAHGGMPRIAIWLAPLDRAYVVDGGQTLSIVLASATMMIIE